MSDEQVVQQYLQQNLILAIRECRSGNVVVEIESAVKAFKKIYYKSVGV